MARHDVLQLYLNRNILAVEAPVVHCTFARETGLVRIFFISMLSKSRALHRHSDFQNCQISDVGMNEQRDLVEL